MPSQAIRRVVAVPVALIGLAFAMESLVVVVSKITAPSAVALFAVVLYGFAAVGCLLTSRRLWLGGTRPTA